LVGREHLGVSVVVFHEGENVVECHVGHQGGAVPVVNDPVPDVDLLAVVENLELGDVHLAVAHPGERFLAIFDPPGVIDAEKLVRVDLLEELRLGGASVAEKSLQRVRLEIAALYVGRGRNGQDQKDRREARQLHQCLLQVTGDPFKSPKLYRAPAIATTGCEGWQDAGDRLEFSID